MQSIHSSASEPPAPSLQIRRLGQIRSRDPRAEGVFWYSVVTTGVYCRPTCPSRHARPENIRLHDSLAEARVTGFRPCGRCRPEAASLYEQHSDLVRAACQLIEGGSKAPKGREIAAVVGLSPSQFYKVFRRITGTTPAGYARSRQGTLWASPVSVSSSEIPDFGTVILGSSPSSPATALPGF
ncbi:Ada metal-binding domain-containing protein [uncultured Brevundimonas sp.]|uniref:Ada metal-binding domain-containing protein n=1 Tax=uncultured Brevundimonas sp. TaxID=213418 RepID=UPI00345D4519